MQSFVLLPPSNDMPQEAETAAGRYRCKGCYCSGRLHVYLSLDARCQMPDTRLLDVELLDASSPSQAPSQPEQSSRRSPQVASGKWAKAKGASLSPLFMPPFPLSRAAVCFEPRSHHSGSTISLETAGTGALTLRSLRRLSNHQTIKPKPPISHHRTLPLARF